MKKIKALLNKENPKTYKENPKTKKDAIRLLFVAPCINSNGYYRVLLPYLELDKLVNFETRVTGVFKWDFNKTYSIGSDTLKEEDIRWATYIIFPMLTGNYAYLFQAIKVLNPKVLLVMDVTEQIHNTHQINASYQVFSKDEQLNFMHNVWQMDMITTPIKKLCGWYRELLHKERSILPKKIEVCWLPSLISKIGYEDITAMAKPHDGILRIGMIGSAKSSEALQEFLPLFKSLKKTYTDKVELVILGWNGKHSNGDEPLKTIDITFHKSVSFLDYFQTIQNLHLDIMLFSMHSLKDYRYSNNIKYMEAAALGIPVIAPELSSYTDVIVDGENGVLASDLTDWEQKLKTLIDDSEYRNRLAAQAKKRVWQDYGYTQGNLVVFENIFL